MILKNILSKIIVKRKERKTLLEIIKTSKITKNLTIDFNIPFY